MVFRLEIRDPPVLNHSFTERRQDAECSHDFLTTLTMHPVTGEAVCAKHMQPVAFPLDPHPGFVTMQDGECHPRADSVAVLHSLTHGGRELPFHPLTKARTAFHLCLMFCHFDLNRRQVKNLAFFDPLSDYCAEIALAMRVFCEFLPFHRVAGCQLRQCFPLVPFLSAARSFAGFAQTFRGWFLLQAVAARRFAAVPVIFRQLVF